MSIRIRVETVLSFFTTLVFRESITSKVDFILSLRYIFLLLRNIRVASPR